MAIDLDKIKRWVETKTIPDGEIFALIERCRKAEAKIAEFIYCEDNPDYSIRNEAYERASQVAFSMFSSREASVIAAAIRNLKSAPPDEEKE